MFAHKSDIKFGINKKNSEILVTAKIRRADSLNSRRLEFMSAKKIHGLLLLKQINKKAIQYTGPYQTSLSEMMINPINKFTFYFIIEQIVDLLQRLKENGLIRSDLILDQQYIFVNETTKEIGFIYLPLERSNEKTDVVDLLEKIVYSVKLPQDEDGNYLSEFAFFIRSLTEFDTEKIEAYILAKERRAVETVKPQMSNNAEYSSGYGKRRTYTQKYEDSEKTEMASDYWEADADEPTDIKKSENDLNFDEKTEMAKPVDDYSYEQDDATGIMPKNQIPRSYGYLRNIKSGKNIEINNDPFRIGQAGYADYAVSSNVHVSKRHADILIRDGRYYLTDLGSSNGTKVNGREVSAHTEIEIYPGDQLTFADEDFIFQG